MTDPHTYTQKITTHGHSIHYRELGQGPPILLIHGWPTSSFLWRNVMPEISDQRRVLAIDLPGFGNSDKPLDVDYDFGFYTSIIDGFLDAVGVDDQLAIAVHDMGGPIGLYWASQRSDRLERLAVLNTVAYPQMSWAARAFLIACKMPGLRSVLTSQWALGLAMKVGVHDTDRLAPDTIEGTRAPFRDRDSRRVLAKTAADMSAKELETIARWLPTVTVPVRVIYGAKDRILPDIEDTVQRLRGDIDHIEVERLDDCGHFLQEEQPRKVGQLLAEFLSPAEE